jgi:multimeric flavodoxin WrbA
MELEKNEHFLLKRCVGKSPNFFNKYLKDLALSLQKEGNTVNHFQLSNMKLSHCIGCFKCWVQASGQCATADEIQEISRTTINSNVVLLASLLVMGFVTALRKKNMDRMIPLVHP